MKIDDKMVIKAYAADCTVDEGERAVIATITTGALDREGEVLVPQGCSTKDFEKNPAVFFNHKYDLPVGRCVSITRKDDAIVAKTVFAMRPESYPADKEWLPDTLFDLYKQKVLRGWSAGAIYREARHPSRKDIEDYGGNCKRVVSKWDMAEYSVAPIPMNPEAISIAVSKSMLSAETAKALFGTEIEETAAEEIEKPLPEPIKTKRIIVVHHWIKPVQKKQPSIQRIIEVAQLKARGRLRA